MDFRGSPVWDSPRCKLICRSARPRGATLLIRKLPEIKDKAERQDKVRDWRKLAIRKKLFDAMPEKLKAALSSAA